MILNEYQRDVLLAVEATEEYANSYGLFLLCLLVERSDTFISPAQIFITLKKLVQLKLIVNNRMKRVDGHNCKLYKLTSHGRKVLDEGRYMLKPIGQT